MSLKRIPLSGLFKIAPLVILLCVALFSGGCGGKKGVKLSPKEVCYMNQESIGGAIKAYRQEKGEYPRSIEDLKRVPHLAGTVGRCPEGGKYIWIPGDPPQVKCTKHGFYK